MLSQEDLARFEDILAAMPVAESDCHVVVLGPATGGPEGLAERILLSLETIFALHKLGR